MPTLVSLAPKTAKPLAACVALLCALALGACGRDEPDLSNGKAQFTQQCGSCHVLSRAGTQGNQGPSLDDAFSVALGDGMDRETVEGIVKSQIDHPRMSSIMKADLVKGDDARDVAAYVAYATGKSGEDEGALAQAGLASAKTGEQIYTAAGCGSCHVFGPAGTNGNVGPNLDELAQVAGDREPGKDAQQYVEEAILNPDAFTVEGFQAGVMPSYEGRLTEAQVKTLAEYLLQGE